MVILLTGFEPIHESLNASEVLINTLKDSPIEPTLKDSLRFAILPGDTDRLPIVLNQLLHQYTPTHVLLTGQAPGRNQITFEQIAINLKHFSSPDRIGNLPDQERILEPGEAAYWATLPNLQGLVALLEAHQVPAAISNHAGTYLCNQALYQTLHLLKGTAVKAGFIHIPILPEQIIQTYSSSPFMPIEMTQKALILVITQLLQSSSPAH